METIVTRQPRLAFAGVGWIGRSRMQAVAESGLADIAIISDTAPQSLIEARKIASISREASFDELIADDDIDGVVIATPSALHMQQALTAFANDKAVFCQKPLGRNYVEVAAVIEAARKSNKLLGTDFSYRYTAAFQRICSIIKSGELGNIFAVDMKFHNAYGPDKPWFYDLSLSGGGCALDLGIHLLDLMLYALDFPGVKKVSSSLFAGGSSVKGKAVVEDYANALIELENDVTATLTCSWNLPAGADAVIEVSFYGTKGGVALKNIAGSFYDFSGLRYWGTKTEVVSAPPDNWGGKALLEWVNKLTVKPGFDDQAGQYLRSAALLDMIYGRMEQL